MISISHLITRSILKVLGVLLTVMVYDQYHPSHHQEYWWCVGCCIDCDSWWSVSPNHPSHHQECWHVRCSVDCDGWYKCHPSHYQQYWRWCIGYFVDFAVRQHGTGGTAHSGCGQESADWGTVPGLWGQFYHCLQKMHTPFAQTYMRTLLQNWLWGHYEAFAPCVVDINTLILHIDPSALKKLKEGRCVKQYEILPAPWQWTKS